MTDKIYTSVDHLKTCTTKEIFDELSHRFSSWVFIMNTEGRTPGSKHSGCFFHGSVAEAKGLSDLSQIYLMKKMLKNVEDED